MDPEAMECRRSETIRSPDQFWQRDLGSRENEGRCLPAEIDLGLGSGASRLSSRLYSETIGMSEPVSMTGRWPSVRILAPS